MVALSENRRLCSSDSLTLRLGSTKGSYGFSAPVGSRDGSPDGAWGESFQGLTDSALGSA